MRWTSLGSRRASICLSYYLTNSYVKLNEYALSSQKMAKDSEINQQHHGKIVKKQIQGEGKLTLNSGIMGRSLNMLPLVRSISIYLTSNWNNK